MPSWLVPTLKWGGIVLTIIAVIAIIYTQFIGVAPAPETGPAPAEAPVTLYWGLLVIGVVAAIAGFVLERRKSPA
jgi:NADH:ubiquinone oxidoreductase subunit 5 (subunit L)/multisubunit Na+/H+ antiporter MnhA subunit